MHRNCRAVLVFRNQCSCRHLSTAAAVQLKPKPQQATARPLPTPKTWSRPPSGQPSSTPISEPLKRRDWSHSLPSSGKSMTEEIPASRQAISAKPSVVTSSLRFDHIPPPNQWNAVPSNSVPHIQRITPLPLPSKQWNSPPIVKPIIAGPVSTNPSNHIPSSKQWNTTDVKDPSPKSTSTSTSSNIPSPKQWTTRVVKPASPMPTSTSPTSSLRPPSTAQSVSYNPRPRTSNQEPTPQFSRERSVQTHKSTNFNGLGTKSASNQQKYQRPNPAYQQSKGIERQGRNIYDKGTTSKTQLKRKPQRKRGRRRDVFIPSTLTVSTLASVLKVKLEYLITRMKRVGMVEEARYDYILNSDYASLLADELGFTPIVDDEAAFDIHPPPPHPNPSSLPSRPPIVTIMGHVDHGKTTLLDTLRSAAVAKGEAGGITQHIGAFSVPVKAVQGENPTSGTQTITFLDTPGHAAFSAMRARGADVTDIIVLVVAADDGIMPQTREVINLLHKEDAQMNLVVAINKVDKPGVDTDAVKKGLMAEGVQLEEFGGDIPAVEVSGLTGQGLPELVETLSAVAEMQDLRAENDGPVFGHVLESNLNKGLGPVATVLVQRGCLKRGSLVISGLSHGKVRSMSDSKGAPVEKALPGMAVIVSGWKSLPKAGDEVLEGSDADIKKALSNRTRKAEAESMQQDIEAINTTRGQERNVGKGDEADIVVDIPTGPKELKLYIKADVSGSGEALEGALNGMGNRVAISKVIGTGVGDITESDVMRAQASKATIIGFSVTVPRAIRTLALQNSVPILTSDIIYRLIDDVRGSLISMLPTFKETKVTGEANVLEVFDIQLKGGRSMKVAGCRVINGLIEKQKTVRVVRAGEIIYEGSLDTMRQIKKDITEARKGVECGMSLKDFSDLRSDDLIQVYETIEKPGVL